MRVVPRVASFLALFLIAMASAANGRAASSASQRHSAPPAARTSDAMSYGKLPLSFEVNLGQADPGVRFLAHGEGYSLFLKCDEAVLALHKTEKADGRTQIKMPGLKEDVVRMQLIGADPAPRVTGEHKLPGRANYFIGNDAKKWRTDVPTFARVQYRNVYPGVDLVYYGNQGRLEYDFVLAAKADPETIGFHFAGAKRLKVRRDGSLDVVMNDGEITFQKPGLYQVENGVRQTVQGKFRLLAGNRIGFSVGNYDRARSLIIDPVLVYSTYFGGSNGGDYGGDYAAAIAVDNSGSTYITGQAVSTDFPVTQGAYQTVNSDGGAIAFVAKLDSTGTQLIYSTYIGGTNGGDYGTGIAVDAAGNAYITGKAATYTFPVTPGAFQSTDNAGSLGNAFVTKLSADGAALDYSSYLGGSNGEIGYAITIDRSGDAYVAGYTGSTNFPVTAGAFQTVNNGSPGDHLNAFVTKVNPTGTALVYSTYLGGNGGTGGARGDYARAITLDGAGDAYVAGYAYSTNFPVSSGAYQFVNHAANGGRNAFITALNSTGSALIYSTYLGGSYDDEAYGIALDAAGNAYVTGDAASSDFPVTAGAFLTAFPGVSTTFVTKLNPTGTGLVYSTFIGITDPLGAYNLGGGIAVNGLGEAYIDGETASSSFPVTLDAFMDTDPGNRAAFVTKLNSAGSALLYSTYFGGSQYDAATALAIDSSGDAYIAGKTLSADFPVSAGAFQTVDAAAANGDSNGFAAKLAIGEETTTTLTSSANPQQQGNAVTFTALVTPNTSEGVPTGSVVFSIDGTSVATVTLDGQGKASYTTSALTTGTHTVQADYSGDTTYLASGGSLSEVIQGNAAATIISPTPGSTLSGSSTTFTWSAGASGASGYFLWIGTAPGAHNIANLGEFTGNSVTVNLPVTGATIYVRLWTFFSGSTHLYNDYTYSEAALAAIISPAPGSTLSGSSTTFTWTAGVGGTTGYYLWIGTSVGTHNIANLGEFTGTSVTVNLPVTGATIYVRLWSVVNGKASLYNDYTYTEANVVAAAITAPVSGSTLSGASTTFTWSSGSGVTGYYLWIGTSAGAHDIANLGEFTTTSTTVNLPTTSATIYVRLWSVVNGRPTLYNDYTYTEAIVVSAAITTPVSGSTLSGASTTFTWTNGSGVTGYYLWIGTSAGAHDIANLGEFTTTSTTVNLPVSGATIYVRLWSVVNGRATLYNDYTYTESGAATLPRAETILYNFTGNSTGSIDGINPTGGLAMDSAGNLYGTTVLGGSERGSYPNLTLGEGTVFKLTPSGTETILYSFGANQTDGSQPNGGLVLDAQGNIYGTTRIGGAFCQCGTVFKVTPSGTETILHSFGAAGDGSNPEEGMIIDSQGNLYGTTGGGGASGDGTVFRIAPDGTETILHSFSGPDGATPGGSSYGVRGLLMDAQKNLYGATWQGGAYNDGVVFKLAPDGTETVLHSFQNNGTDGTSANGGLVLDAQGNLYGSTYNGGSVSEGNGVGLLYKLAPDGTETVLFNFSGNPILGSPQDGLVMDANGNIFGTATEEHAGVFELSPTGVVTLLHSFPAQSYDGALPQGGPLLDANGNLYGTTSDGGSANSGIVYKLSASISTAQTPTFSMAPGTYSSAQTITITEATPGATIYYMPPGSIYWTPYTGPVTISSTGTLITYATAPGYADSAMTMATYTIQ
jgi:uncharacterized repeat protein (TIGR03803 family)